MGATGRAKSSGLATFDRCRWGGRWTGMSFTVCHEGWHWYHFFSASLSMLECMTAHDERHPQEGGLAPLNLVLAANKSSWSAAEESATPRGSHCHVPWLACGLNPRVQSVCAS